MSFGLPKGTKAATFFYTIKKGPKPFRKKNQETKIYKKS